MTTKWTACEGSTFPHRCPFLITIPMHGGHRMTLYLSNEPVQRKRRRKRAFRDLPSRHCPDSVKPSGGVPFSSTVSQRKQQNIYRSLALHPPAQYQAVCIYKTARSTPYSGDAAHLPGLNVRLERTEQNCHVESRSSV